MSSKQWDFDSQHSEFSRQDKDQFKFRATRYKDSSSHEESLKIESLVCDSNKKYVDNALSLQLPISLNVTFRL